MRSLLLLTLLPMALYGCSEDSSKIPGDSGGGGDADADTDADVVCAGATTLAGDWTIVHGDDAEALCANGERLLLEGDLTYSGDLDQDPGRLSCVCGVQGRLRIDAHWGRNDSLQAFTELEYVGENLEDNCYYCSSITGPASLRSITGGLVLEGGATTASGFAGLVELGYLAGREADIERIEGFDVLSAMGKLYVADSNLTDVTGMRNVTATGSISIIGARNSEFEFEAVEQADGVRLLGNYALRSVSFPSLRTVAGDLEVQSYSGEEFNEALVTLGGFDAVTTVAGSVTIADNPALRSIDTFESLASIEGDLVVSGNPELSWCPGLERLAEVRVGGTRSVSDYVDDRSTYYLDADGDGAGVATTTRSCALPDGYASVGGDCDDADGSVHPGAVDDCSSVAVDDDCDGEIDEDC